MVLGALRSALSAKFADQKLIVVDSWQLDSHKTKPFRQALDRLDGNEDGSVGGDCSESNLELASRNLEGVKLVRAARVATVRPAAARPPGAVERRGRAAGNDAWAAYRNARVRSCYDRSGGLSKLRKLPRPQPKKKAAPAKKAARRNRRQRKDKGKK